jgi:hypothetical protein
MSFFRGSERAVLEALQRHRSWDGLEWDAEHQTVVNLGVQAIVEGAWLVNLQGGFRFEVFEEPLTVEQDAYGCRLGRACSDVDESLRPDIEAMIASRVVAGQGSDCRYFHWYRRLNSAEYYPQRVRSFVMNTLGSALVADAAVVLANNAATYSPGQIFDVHLTLMPDRLRLRVDDDGRSARAGHMAPVVRGRGPDGDVRGGLAFIDMHASKWGFLGQDCGGWSVWAEFARTEGDAAQLARNYRLLSAREVRPGAYFYRGGDHMAWVEARAVRVVGDTVILDAADGYSGLTLGASEELAVFVSDAGDEVSTPLES